MSKDLREAMLAEMLALCLNIEMLSAGADELARSADRLDGQPLSGALRDGARRKRVKILELQGQQAALNVTFTERFGTEP